MTLLSQREDSGLAGSLEASGSHRTWDTPGGPPGRALGPKVSGSHRTWDTPGGTLGRVLSLQGWCLGRPTAWSLGTVRLVTRWPSPTSLNLTWVLGRLPQPPSQGQTLLCSQRTATGPGPPSPVSGSHLSGAGCGMCERGTARNTHIHIHTCTHTPCTCPYTEAYLHTHTCTH